MTGRTVIVEVPGHGEVEFPEGMSEADMASAIRKNFMLPALEKPKSTMGKVKDAVLGSDPVRSLALGARGVAEGAMALPLMAGDAMNSLFNLGARGVNALGGNVPTLPMASQSAGNLLTQSGAPVAESPSEKLLYGISKGGSGGAAFPAMVPGAAVPAMQAASGALSSGVTQGAENLGASPLLSSALGVASGMAVPSSPDVLGAAGRATKAAVQPFTGGGREEIVGNALSRMATQPKQALMNMSAASDDVSRLTTAQASKDPGLLSTERALANLPGSGGRFANRYADQNSARRSLMDSMAGTVDDLKAAKTARGSAAETQYAEAFATGPLKPTEALISISKRPAFESASKKAMEIAGNEGLDLGDPTNTMRGLHYLKMGVDDLIDNARQGTNEFRALSKMKGDLLAAMDDLSPAYKTARQKFAETSKPINQMETLQELRTKTLNSGLDVKGNRIMSQAKFTTAVTDNMEDLKKSLSPRQIDNLQKIAKDLDYGKLSEMGGKVAGSNTFQNLSVANVLGSILGKDLAESAVAQSALRPLGFIYKMPERQVEELMIEAMLDRNMAMTLMSKASQKNIEQLAKGLKQRMGASAMGSIAGQAGQE